MFQVDTIKKLIFLGRQLSYELFWNLKSSIKPISYIISRNKQENQTKELYETEEEESSSINLSYIDMNI